MICCAERTCSMSWWGKLMKYLSEGSVFKKCLKFLNMHIGYLQFLNCSQFVLLYFLQFLTALFCRHLRNSPLKLTRLKRATTLMNMKLACQKSMESVRTAQMAFTHPPLIATLHIQLLIWSYRAACASGMYQSPMDLPFGTRHQCMVVINGPWSQFLRFLSKWAWELSVNSRLASKQTACFLVESYLLEYACFLVENYLLVENFNCVLMKLSQPTSMR